MPLPARRRTSVGNTRETVSQNGSTDCSSRSSPAFPLQSWRLAIEAQQDGTLLVDASHLFIRDAVDLLSQLRHPTQIVGGTMVRTKVLEQAGMWMNSSVIDLDHSGSFL